MLPAVNEFFFQIMLKIMLVFKIMLLFLNVCLKIKKLKTSPKTQIVYLLLIKHHILYLELHACPNKTQPTTELHSRLEAVT